MSIHYSEPACKNAPHHVRMVGTESRVCGADTLDEAKANADERNKRAEEFGVKARYEAV